MNSINKLEKFYGPNGKISSWYINTYNALGSKWLIGTLNNIFFDNSNINILSPTSNAGLYEKDAFDTLNNINFVLCDAIMESIDHVKSETNNNSNTLTVLNENQNAFYLINDMKFKNKFDIILDIKGALWYTLYTHDVNKRDKLKNLLKSYKYCMKDNNSFLLIDYYSFTIFERIKSNFKWLKNSWKKKEGKITCFNEMSTGSMLLPYLYKAEKNYIPIIYKDFYEDGKILSSKMGVLRLSLYDIDNLINIL